jgi:hypothetical protein
MLETNMSGGTQVRTIGAHSKKVVNEDNAEMRERNITQRRTKSLSLN